MVIGIQWIIFIGVAVLSWLVQLNLQNKFKKYSRIPTGNGMTGADVARKMLHDNGIYDVQVTHTPGHLTDHYNPANKTVNLSESVYSSNSIMAAAVAAGDFIGGYHPVRHDHVVQLRHPSGGNQCQQACIGMAQCIWHYERLQS